MFSSKYFFSSLQSMSFGLLILTLSSRLSTIVFTFIIKLSYNELGISDKALSFAKKVSFEGLFKIFYHLSLNLEIFV